MANEAELEQHMAEVLGSHQFETLISALMSSSNADRGSAESLFNLCRARHPETLTLKLAHLLHSSSHAELKSMSAILLRKLLTTSTSNSSIYSQLSPSAQSTLKSLLLSSLDQDTPKSISKSLCDCISELAAAILPDSAWPELILFFQSTSSPDSHPRLQESSLLIFARLSEYIADSLTQHLSTIHSLLAVSLMDPASPDVLIAALTASVNLVQYLSSSSDRDTLQDLLPSMIGALTDHLNSGQKASTQEALELLVELAGTEPRFLRRQIVYVVNTMLQVAGEEQHKEGTRHLAVEFVVTLAEARERASRMMRKCPHFVRRLFAILMKMLLDIDDEPAWHSAVEKDEDAGETSNYGVAQECLDRLSIAIGGNEVVPIASEFLSDYLSSPDWQKHHAALITLAQIAEGCAKVMLKDLEQVVGMILNGFQHPHPRVRWAAINAIGQLLSSDLGPNLRTQYHQKILPALANAMENFQLNPRVQAHAASAILNFSENCTPEILTPYLDGIVSKLLLLLQNGKQMVQEGALTALASVADSSQEQFQKYYDAVMPYLKAILVNAIDKSSRMLRAKSMECISLVGMAVGKDKFRDHAKQVMDVLMSLQGSELENDDPITSYMLQAWARLCKCLGQDFLPYMSVVMPPLLQSAQSYDDSIETITLGDKRIGIRTSVLEEKATACNMLCCYADELKESFFPWIDQVAPTLVPLLKFYFHEEVRRAAVASMPQLLRSAKMAIEKGQAGGRDDYLEQLSEYIVPALVEALHKEPETEIAASMLASLHECMQLSGTLRGESRFQAIVDGTKNVTTASATRKRVRSERAEAGDFDVDERDERELLQEENKLELIKKIVSGDFSEICLILKKQLTTDVNTEAVVDVIQAIGNLVYFGNHSQYLLPVLLEKFKDKNLTLRNALSETLQAMHKSGCLSLMDVVEDVKVALKHEDPLVRSQTLNWVAFCMETSNLANVLELFKVYKPICMECLNDETPEVRDASFSVFAATCKMFDMKRKKKLLKKLENKLDEDGKKKLSEMIGIPPTSTPGASNNKMLVRVKMVQSDLIKKLWGPNSCGILDMDLEKLSRNQLKNLYAPNGGKDLENLTRGQLMVRLKELDKVLILDKDLSEELWLKANQEQIASLPQFQTRGLNKSINSQSVVEQPQADGRRIFRNLQSKMKHVKEKQKKKELNPLLQKGSYYRDKKRTILQAIKDTLEQLIDRSRLLIKATEEEYARILKDIDQISIQSSKIKEEIENENNINQKLDEELNCKRESNQKLYDMIHSLENSELHKTTQKKKKQTEQKKKKQRV